MEIENLSKTVKKYRQGNSTAAFGTELMTLGNTSIPNLLLRFYKEIGITDLEMIALIQILRIRTEEKELYPSPEHLSQCLTSSQEEINEIMESLLQKEVIAHTHYYDEELDEILNGYDLEPLMEKLSEIWACAKMHEIEKTRFLLESNKAAPETKTRASNKLYHAFEREFGRPLSPMEVNQIQKWMEYTKQEDIIIEALRRSVLIGKLNFKYIDSILQEWIKNNLRTLQDVEQYDKDYQSRKSKNRSSREKSSEKSSNYDHSSSEDKKKEFIRTLYTG